MHQHACLAGLWGEAGARAGAVEPGIWQIMPTYIGDHMSLQGGILKRNDIRPFYLELLELTDALPES